MADTVYNQWGTITFEVPDKLAKVRENINNVAEFLVAVLDIAVTALDLVKTFLVGYLDPIAALVNTIIIEVESLIQDMRQIGLYITGDWNLLNPPFDELQGGYQEYQRRMVARLTDLTDPSRPNVSAETKVLAMFFYLSVNVSEIDRLIRFIKQLTRFFNQSFSPQGSLPIPTTGAVQYGTNAVDILHPSSLTTLLEVNPDPPKLAKIRWGLASTAQKHPFNPIPILPPGGFLISVSTVQDGLKLVFDSPQSNTSLQPSSADPAKIIQPRDYGQVRVSDTGVPFILHGGSDLVPLANLKLSNGQDISYNANVNKGDQGVTKVYAQKVTGDDQIIPLDDLANNGKPLLQRVFYIPLTSKWLGWINGEYSFELKAEDLPYECTWETQPNGKITPKNIKQATTAYVRVASLSSAAYDKKMQYIFQPPNARAGTPFVEASLKGLAEFDASSWSRPVRVTFPGINTRDYLEALKSALLVLVLSRPDLKVYDPANYALKIQKDVADGKTLLDKQVKNPSGLESMAHLADMVLADYQRAIEIKGDNPINFRKVLYESIQRVAYDIYERTGRNDQVEKFVVDNTEYLRTVTWKKLLAASFNQNWNLPTDLADAKLLESIDIKGKGGNDEYGLARNPYSIRVDETRVKDWFFVSGAIQGRAPDMFEVKEGAPDDSVSTQMQVPKEQVEAFMAKLNPGMKAFYEQHKQKDGSIQVDPKFQAGLVSLATRTRIHGSADLSPVFVMQRLKLSALTDNTTNYSPATNGALIYCRGIFAKANNGQILQESYTALSLAAAAFRRSSKDGAWIAIRFFDMFPSMDDFFASVSNWMKSLQKALKSIIDTIKRYIEFIEGRIVEIQALIRRINDLLQSLLGFAFQIPKCSYLTTVSDGTQGVVKDLVASKSKPSDNIQAYGAGIAVVIPFGPALAMDLIQALFLAAQGTPNAGETLGSPTNLVAVGIEGLPSPPTPGDEPPDVL